MVDLKKDCLVVRAVAWDSKAVGSIPCSADFLYGLGQVMEAWSTLESYTDIATLD